MPVFLIYPCLALVLALKMGLGPTVSIDKKGLCIGPCLLNGFMNHIGVAKCFCKVEHNGDTSVRISNRH